MRSSTRSSVARSSSLALRAALRAARREPRRAHAARAPTISATRSPSAPRHERIVSLNPDDDRAALRHRRRRRARRAHAVRPLARFGASPSPTSATGCARTSRRCSPRIPISSSSTRATTIATPRVACAPPASRPRAYAIDRIADFARVTRVARPPHRRHGRRARARWTRCRRTLDRVRAATATLPHPTVFWPLWEKPLLADRRRQLPQRAARRSPAARNVYADMPQPSPRVTLRGPAAAQSRRHPPSARRRATRISTDPRWQALARRARRTRARRSTRRS